MLAFPKIFAQAPCAALRPFVRRLMVVEHSSQCDDLHLPGTGAVAAFNVRGECILDGKSRVPSAGFTGLWDGPRRHEHRDGNTVVLVHFTPVGAACLVTEPLEEFANGTASLRSLAGESGDIERVEEQLNEAPNHARRVALLEAFLLARAARSEPDPLVAAAVEWIECAPLETRIAALTKHIGLSQSALERRFRRAVGVTPRKFASLVRLQRVLRLHEPGMRLTRLAASAGYFDQSHFIHEFRRFSGVTPSAYFSTAG